MEGYIVYAHNVWPNMVLYIHGFRVLNFELIYVAEVPFHEKHLKMMFVLLPYLPKGKSSSTCFQYPMDQGTFSESHVSY